MTPTQMIQSLSNPNQVVFFTFNTSKGNWFSGHTVVLDAYNSDSQKFGFLNSGWKPQYQQANDLTWFSINQVEAYTKDPIGLWEPNFTVITRP